MEKERLSKLKSILAAQGVSAVLVSKPENIYYLTGFTGSSGTLVVTEDKNLLFTDFRYKQQAQKEAKGFEVKIVKEGEEFEELSKLLRELKAKTVGFEAHYLSYRNCQQLARKTAPLALKPLSEVVEKLRVLKDEAEIANILKAAELGDQAFSHLLPLIKPGVSEKDLALELEFFMRRKGAQKVSFEVIVASGSRSAMPHAKTTEKRLKLGEFVKLDFGAVFQEYHSDMTRTLVLGKASKKQQNIYNLVLQAQKRALREISPGIKAKEVDKIARDYLSSAGYSQEFGHNLGHGVGLEIHESPILAPKGEDVLEARMVFTIEPGLYIPNFGGVRIEDLVLLRQNKVEILTKSSKELIEL